MAWGVSQFRGRLRAVYLEDFLAMGRPWKLTLALMLVMVVPGCVTNQGTGGSGSSPPPGVQPARKKELPWLNVPGGQMNTTLIYGPWQCRQEFMRSCQRECLQNGHTLMGCLWLADIKLDWEGHLALPPLPVRAGGRYGIWHCCCDYRTLEPEKKKRLRDAWEGIRESFRQDWSRRFGEWPTDKGKYWPGHHIHDLWHAGAPVDPNNIIPAEPGVHDIYNKVYPACYAGQPPWNTSGPDLPYSDH